MKKKSAFYSLVKTAPQNNNGWICAKEYEDKCLAQKIQYIKELHEENTELKAEIEDWKDSCRMFPKED